MVENQITNKDLNNNLVLILSTESNAENAKKLAKKILHRKLAACVSFAEVNSIYWWKDKLEDNSEIQLTIKTTMELEKKVLKFIMDNHSYSLPEMICLKGEASEQYFKWMNQILR